MANEKQSGSRILQKKIDELTKKLQNNSNYALAKFGDKEAISKLRQSPEYNSCQDFVYALRIYNESNEGSHAVRTLQSDSDLIKRVDTIFQETNLGNFIIHPEPTYTGYAKFIPAEKNTASQAQKEIKSQPSSQENPIHSEQTTYYPKKSRESPSPLKPNGKPDK